MPNKGRKKFEITL